MDLKISAEELRKRKVFVATPMYGGMCGGQYTKSVADLATLATKYGMDVRFSFLYNESLITRARNYLVDSFLRSDCTHLMFIDSDIGFDANDVIGLAAIAKSGSDKHIVCGPYPKKRIAWENVKLAVEKGLADTDPNTLASFIGDFVFNPVEGTQRIEISEPVEVLEGGTGFMMIQRGVFEQYAKTYPHLYYKPDHSTTQDFDGSRQIMAYFDCVIDPKTKRYLSEDYMFCQYARRAGLKVWLCPWMRLSHMGTYTFSGSLTDLARLKQ